MAVSNYFVPYTYLSRPALNFLVTNSFSKVGHRALMVRCRVSLWNQPRLQADQQLNEGDEPGLFKLAVIGMHFIDLKSNFSLFPRWSHNFSLGDFPQTSLILRINGSEGSYFPHPCFCFLKVRAQTFLLPALGCALCCHMTNQTGMLNQIRCKIRK